MTDLLFTETTGEVASTGGARQRPWHVLVVDDEEDVHAVTNLVLENLVYRGRSVALHHAYSAEEAKAQLDAVPDTALILLDVVMETDDAGLRLVEHIRNERKNRMARIILRTGQPGQAPERRVIHNYDINDYKSKTEFTATKLYTTTLTALRAYEDIVTLDMSRRGIQKMLAAASSLFREGILCVYQVGCAEASTGNLYVLASAGEFEQINGALSDTALQHDVADTIVGAMRTRANLQNDGGTARYFETQGQRRIVVYLRDAGSLGEMEQKLLQVFCEQVSIAVDNLHLYEDLTNA